MKKDASALQHPVKFTVKIGRIQLSSHIEHGGIVDNRLKYAVCKFFDDIPGVPDMAGDIFGRKQSF